MKLLHKFDVVVALRLKAAVHNVSTDHWQQCLSLWVKLRRAASRQCCDVHFSGIDDSCKLTSSDTLVAEHTQWLAVSQLQKPAKDVGSKSAVKRSSTDLVTFRVSAKCAGGTSSFNSQVLVISC